MPLNVVILAAGQGKRMYSDLPKVLHPLAGKPLLKHVLDTVKLLSAHIYVIYGYEGEQVKAAIQDASIHWVYQEQPLGTAHAVRQALPFLSEHHRVLVLYGDGPLISKATLERLLESTPENGIGWLTAVVSQPFGLGRILRDAQGQAQGIVEEKDASPEEKAISEINSGICLFPPHYLQEHLPKIKPHNAQGEYYLTDLFAVAIAEKTPLVTVHPDFELEIQGVNDQLQLARLERAYQLAYAEQLMRQGLLLADPHRLDVRGELTIGRNVSIDINVVIEGQVSLGDGVKIGPNVVIRNSRIGPRVVIEANSVIEGAVLEEGSKVGPFARLRPGTILKSKAKIGNFVEVKNTVLGEHSKAGHLSYLGDAVIGQDVNIGAGTITCNYDGVNKHQTIIEDQVFVGSNTALVAPLTIERGATIGAGSTIVKKVTAGELSVARAQQVTVPGWQRPKKQGKS